MGHLRPRGAVDFSVLSRFALDIVGVPHLDSYGITSSRGPCIPNPGTARSNERPRWMTGRAWPSSGGRGTFLNPEERGGGGGVGAVGRHRGGQARANRDTGFGTGGSKEAGARPQSRFLSERFWEERSSARFACTRSVEDMSTKFTCPIPIGFGVSSNYDAREAVRARTICAKASSNNGAAYIVTVKTPCVSK